MFLKHDIVRVFPLPSRWSSDLHELWEEVVLVVGEQFVLGEVGVLGHDAADAVTALLDARHVHCSIVPAPELGIGRGCGGASTPSGKDIAWREQWVVGLLGGPWHGYGYGQVCYRYWGCRGSRDAYKGGGWSPWLDPPPPPYVMLESNA